MKTWQIIGVLVLLLTGVGAIPALYFIAMATAENQREENEKLRRLVNK